MKIQKLVLVVTALLFTLNSVAVALNASPQSEPPASEPAPTQTPPASDSASANIPMLRAQARQAMSRSQWASAADLWSAISVQVPGDAEAIKGLSDAQAALNQGSSIDKVAGDEAVEREQAQVEFDNALVRSGESFSRGDYAGAERIATQAKMSLQRNKALLSPADFDAKMASVEAELVKINSAKTLNAEAAKAIKASDASKSTVTQNRQELEQRQRTINEDMVRVRQLQSELKYTEALEVVEEILFIDPTNPSALAMRDVLQSGILYRRYSELQRRRSYSFSEFSVDAQASFIPPKINISGPGPRSLDAEMSYPEDWPALSVRREGAYAASGFRDSEIDQKAIARMQEKSRIDFPESPFSSVVEFFQTETKLPFYVDYKSLRASEPTLDKDSTVNLTMPAAISWAMALDMVLRSTEEDGASGSRDGADNRPDWMIENGMVVIASATELALRRVTIVYDIRDLLYQVPYFDNAPNFNVDAALNQGGGQGGGGGGGSGGGGGGGFGGGGGPFGGQGGFDPFAGAGGGGSPAGQDVEYPLQISFLDSWRGCERQISFRLGDGSKRDFRMKIPAGVKDGGKLRVPGKGVASPYGGPPGDVHVIIQISPNAQFERVADDIHTKVKIKPSIAFLGGSAEVETPEGSKTVKVPVGVQPGTKLRLKELGFPYPGKGNARGDLYAILEVDIPKTLTPDQEQAVKALQEAGL